MRGLAFAMLGAAVGMLSTAAIPQGPTYQYGYTPSSSDYPPPYHLPLVFKAGGLERLEQWQPTARIYSDRVEVTFASPPPGWPNAMVYPRVLVDSWPGGFIYWADLLKDAPLLTDVEVIDLRP